MDPTVYPADFMRIRERYPEPMFPIESFCKDPMHSDEYQLLKCHKPNFITDIISVAERNNLTKCWDKKLKVGLKCLHNIIKRGVFCPVFTESKCSPRKLPPLHLEVLS